jgi:hypothetical protein
MRNYVSNVKVEETMKMELYLAVFVNSKPLVSDERCTSRGCRL